jgi:hypothetical protein
MRTLAVLFLGVLLASVSAQSEPLALSLRDAVGAAVRLNPQIQIAKLRALESRGQYGVVRSALG